MLNVDGIHTYYGLSHILFDVSLRVRPGEIVCLLGRNGAGKSTTMRSIMGLTPPRQGRIRFADSEIGGLKPFQIARLGIGYVPDDRRVFADLSVDENLEIVEGVRGNDDPWTRDRIYDFFPPLRGIANRKAGLLSGGEQQMLTIGRALMTNPKLILLDEPTEGLAPLVVKTLSDQIRQLRENGVTVLLAEQNQRVALSLSDRAYVIDNGIIRFHGTIEELQQNDVIRQKYLML